MLFSYYILNFESNQGAYTRGLAAQYDAWSSLLTVDEQELNWNWNSLFSYMKIVRAQVQILLNIFSSYGSLKHFLLPTPSKPPKEPSRSQTTMEPLAPSRLHTRTSTIWLSLVQNTLTSDAVTSCMEALNNLTLCRLSMKHTMLTFAQTSTAALPTAYRTPL